MKRTKHFVRNNWRSDALKAPPKLRAALRTVVQSRKKAEIEEAIAAMDGSDTVEPATVQYFALQKLATTQVMNDLSATERAELEAESRQWGLKGYPPEVQAK